MNEVQATNGYAGVSNGAHPPDKLKSGEPIVWSVSQAEMGQWLGYDEHRKPRLGDVVEWPLNAIPRVGKVTSLGAVFCEPGHIGIEFVPYPGSRYWRNPSECKYWVPLGMKWAATDGVSWVELGPTIGAAPESDTEKAKSDEPEDSKPFVEEYPGEGHEIDAYIAFSDYNEAVDDGKPSDELASLHVAAIVSAVRAALEQHMAEERKRHPVMVATVDKDGATDAEVEGLKLAVKRWVSIVGETMTILGGPDTDALKDVVEYAKRVKARADAAPSGWLSQAGTADLTRRETELRSILAAKEGESLVDCAKRVVAYPPCLTECRQEESRRHDGKPSYYGLVHKLSDVLGAKEGETLVDAAARVVRQNDRGDLSRIDEVYEALGVKGHESALTAAKRVVSERDEARGQFDEARRLHEHFVTGYKAASDLLGCQPGESVVDGVNRLRRSKVAQDEICRMNASELRWVLDANEDEQYMAAAKRVMKELDEAKADAGRAIAMVKELEMVHGPVKADKERTKLGVALGHVREVLGEKAAQFMRTGDVFVIKLRGEDGYNIHWEER